MYRTGDVVDMAMEGVPENLEHAVLMALERLMEDQPIAFFELNEICKNAHHKLFGNAEEKLDEHGLLEASGKPHKTTCEILKAHTKGSGPTLELFR